MTMGIAIILGFINNLNNKLSALVDENGETIVDENGEEFFI